MNSVRECRRRQVKLLKLIKALEEDVLLDDDTIERLKRRIGKSVGLYEKAIHVLNREQVGHA